MELSSYIKTRREAKGLSIRGLADAAGVSHTEIKRIEDGIRKQPSPAKLKAIAEALSTNYEAMMSSAGYIELERVGIAPSGIDGAEDLTPEETKKVEEYIAFLKTTRQ
jgi:transcriptional regulator with XRE-family HTH domain